MLRTVGRHAMGTIIQNIGCQSVKSRKSISRENENALRMFVIELAGTTEESRCPTLFGMVVRRSCSV